MDYQFQTLLLAFIPPWNFEFQKLSGLQLMWCLPKSSMPLAALLEAWSPTFADSFIAIAVKKLKN